MTERIIYHYTNNIISVLSNKELWLTRSVQSNDSLDSRVLMKLFSTYKFSDFIWKCINEEYKKLGLDEIRPLHGFDIFGRLKLIFSQIDNTTLDNMNKFKGNDYSAFFPLYAPFVVCFTNESMKDSRLLFDAYTSNTGCVIGFNKQKLNQVCQELTLKGYSIQMTDIIYDDLEQVDYIKDIISKRISEYYSKCLSPGVVNIDDIKELAPMTASSARFQMADKDNNIVILIEQCLNGVIEYVSTELCKTMPMLKNSFWKEEKETRLISYNTYKDLKNQFNVKHTKSLSIEQRPSKYKDQDNFDFVKLPFMSDAIEEIIIGPCVEEDEVNKIVDLAKLFEVDVFFSNGFEIVVNREG